MINEPGIARAKGALVALQPVSPDLKLFPVSEIEKVPVNTQETFGALCDGLCWLPLTAIQIDRFLGVDLQVNTAEPTTTGTSTATPTATPTRTPFPTAAPATLTLTPTLTSSPTTTIIPTLTITPTLTLESLPTLLYTLPVSTPTATISPTASPTLVPSETPSGPDQVIIEMVQSGYFLQTLLILLLIAFWGIVSTGLFIYLRNRNKL